MSMYPPGAANNPFAPYNQQDEPEEWTTARRHAKAILDRYGADNWGSVARKIYKYTNCGASLSVSVWGTDNQQYGKQLWTLDATAPVIAVHVSSIVEGIDFGTEEYTVDLRQKGTRRTGTIQKRLDRAIQDVEDEAHDIWMQTHGCEDCGMGEGEWGYEMVNPSCASCNGHGTIM